MKKLREFVRKTLIEGLNEKEEWFSDVEDPDGEFEEWFYQPPSQQEIDLHKHYQEGGVVWLGDEGSMLRVHKSQVDAMEDNIFDPEKVAAFAREIRNNAPIYTYAPIGAVWTLRIGEVQESLENEDGKYTTGNEDLDEYLTDPSEYIGLYYDEGVEVLKKGLEQSQKDFIEENRDEDHHQEISDLDEQWIDEWKEYVSAYQHIVKMEKLKQEAAKKSWGDVNSIRVQIRDGNHRTFGAIKAGEKWIWVSVIEQYSNMEAIKGDLR